MKKTDADKFTRIWRMLNLIPGSPRTTTVKEILEGLGADYQVEPRTIERNLNDLSGYPDWPLVSELRGRTKHWWFAGHSKIIQLPNMDLETALAFKLIEKFSLKMLPDSIIEKVSEHLKLAEETINIKYPGYKGWPEKIMMVADTPLLPPEVKEGVIEKVYDALLKEQMIRVNHYQKGNEEPYSFEANPLGLVFRDYTIYLICTTSYTDYEEVEYKPLHRIRELEILAEKSEIPENFDLNDYVNNQQELSWKFSEKNLDFKAEFDYAIAFMLYETPLSREQKITELENGNIIVEAKVNDTLQLRNWLLNLGDQVRIISPKSLYNEFKRTAEGLNKLYRTGKTKI